MENICGSFHYVGDYDKSVFYDYGDIVQLSDGSFAVCTDVGRFDYLGSFTDTVKEPDRVKVRITQCRNCGAPTDRNGHCDYCNTYN